ncbi:MAG: hypothetical protein PF501_20165 [Salinisphaera sp.]|jgi:hypothetical protein|nr:hypothetical protein [Salinisphaera sp.]
MIAIIKAFIAGFVATLTFHQGLLWGLDRLQVLSATAWRMTPVPPLGVPSVISLAFWGGLWGIVIWLLIRNALAAGYYVGAVILGAILPTLVALTLVPLTRGTSVDTMVGGLTLHHAAIGLALNGAFGLGVAIFMRIMHPPR